MPTVTHKITISTDQGSWGSAEEDIVIQAKSDLEALTTSTVIVEVTIVPRPLKLPPHRE
jgi:hypothetical protein